MFGLRTFTTTWSPLLSVAEWTCARDAAAKGISSNDSKIFSIESPNSDSTIFLSVSTLNGLQLSVRLSKSFAVSTSRISVLVDKSWPNFVNIILKSNIDVIYLIDKYFGNTSAVFAYSVLKLFKSSDNDSDIEYENIRKRLREISIKLDRLEAIKDIWILLS